VGARHRVEKLSLDHGGEREHFGTLLLTECRVEIMSLHA
jgi:hypothetical protein